MKKVFLFLCLVFSFKALAVDGGYAYRFHVKITQKNGESQHGYMYKHSYNKFIQYETNIIKYLKENYTKEIDLYPHIVSINAKENNIDFTLEGTKKQIQIEDVEEIRIAEILSFIPGERIKELSQAQYQLIATSKVKFEIIEDVNIYENLKFILFTWDEDKVLSQRKNSIAKKIKEKWKCFIDVEIIQSEKFNAFMKILKEDLLKEKILLIEFAELL